MKSNRGGRRVARVLVCLVAAVVALPIAEAPAGAVAPAPALQSPADGAGAQCPVPDCVTANPIFNWSAVAGAVSYQIQVSTSNAFGTTVYDTSVSGTSATPTADLPQSLLYWRVRTNDSSGAGPWSSPFSFTKSQPPGPVPVAPLDEGNCNPNPGGNCANQLVFPTDAPTLRWQPLAGAAYYKVEVSNNDTFTPPLVLNATTTTNTSFTLPDPLAMNQLYWWHVQAFSADDRPTQFSPSWTFSFTWSQGQPQGLYPPDAATVQEVDLAWDPVPGAATYQVQVSPNIDFTSFTVNLQNVQGTRVTPQTTIPAGAYYWRVRAVTSKGTAGPWSDAPAPPHSFTRTWPYPDDHPVNPVPAELQRVVPLAPIGAVTTATPSYKWSPVRLASKYELQLSTNDPNFSSPATCTVRNTTFTPDEECQSVLPQAGQISYWRVRPVDEPGNILGVYSPTASFIWNPGTVAQVSPANGANVTSTLLTWTLIPGISRYRVEVLENGSVVTTKDTYNTGWAPEGLQAGKTYTWRVMPMTANGRVGAITQATTRSFNLVAPSSFGAAPNPTTPNPNQGYTLPPLTWQDVAPVPCSPQPCTTDPVTYRVYIGVLGQGFVQVAETPFAAYAYPEGDYLPGAWSWKVDAIQSGNVIASGSVGQATILELSATTLTGPQSCTTAGCATLWDTPNLTWNHVSGAAIYRVQIATDVNFTNVIFDQSTVFDNLTAMNNLVDQQAGQALYWYAKPCKVSKTTQCGPGPDTYAGQWPATTPVRAFRKQSAPIAANPVNDPSVVHGASPTAGTVTDQTTFSWTDFLDTNQAIVPAAQNPAAAVPTQEARVYRVQVSTASDMSTIIDQIEVDGTQYTATDKMYPDGPVYWRVQARDGTGNYLTWSCTTNQPATNPTCPAGSQTPRLVTKTSPAPALLEPSPGASLNEVPTFRWAPVAFSKSYDIEIYKNPDQALNASNLVLGTSANRAVTAYTPVTALPGPGTYGWRVRRRDANNNAGQWSAQDNTQLRLFSYAGNAATLTAPDDAASVLYNQLVFQWQTAAGAARYRINVTVNPPNGQGILTSPYVDQRTTVMTAWAPQTPRYADGLYYWQIETLNKDGVVTARSAVRTVNVVSPGAAFHSMTPFRILDTRNGTGASGTIGQGGVKSLQVAGVSGIGGQSIPSSATAVVMNVTATGPTAASYMTVYPNGSSTPTAANLVYAPGQTVPNLVTVKIGSSGKVNFYNQLGSVHAVADVLGYYDDGADPTGSLFNGITPVRALDSRTSTGNFGGPIGPGGTKNLSITGVPQVPGTRTAVVMNVTATGGTAASYLSVVPGRAPFSAPNDLPLTANVNFSAGQTVPNLVVVGVPSTGPYAGQVSFYNQLGSVHVIADIVGYFDPTPGGGKFHPITPTRMLDSRSNIGRNGKWNAGTNATVVFGGRAPLPAATRGIVGNVTVTGGSAASYLSLSPTPGPNPAPTANLLFGKNQTIPNAAYVKTGTGGGVDIYNQLGSVDVILDVGGYFASY